MAGSKADENPNRDVGVPLIPDDTAPMWPTELQSPDDIIGMGGLDAEYKRRLADEQTMFVVTGARRFFWPTEGEGVSIDAIFAPDSHHPTMWRGTMALGLPKDPDPEKPTERSRLLDYFEQGGTRAVGPLVFVEIPTSHPQPYLAMRKAPEDVLRRFTQGALKGPGSS